jgi:hypothetical protein
MKRLVLCVCVFVVLGAALAAQTAPAKPSQAAITTVASLTSYLAGLPGNDDQTPHTVPLALAFNTDEVQSGQVAWADINAAVTGKYVILDLSGCTAAHDTTANTIEGAYSPSGNHFDIIQDNTYIKGIILPASLRSIGDHAFSYCRDLTSVTLPASLTSIGGTAFSFCSSLTFTVAVTGAWTTTANGKILIEDGTTVVAGSGASDSVDLSSLTGLTSIGENAFLGCSDLTSITLPARLTSIGWGAFQNCSGLTSVTLPASLTTIADYAFVRCDRLSAISLPTSLAYVGSSTFAGCDDLQTVVFGGNGVTINSANSFPGDGASLKAAYESGKQGSNKGVAGTYKRDATGSWSRQGK